jgi:hypothetical protein
VRTSYAIAAWIFELLGLDDALAGDLLEEHALGCSGIWYWRQVLIAILISIYRDIRDHKVLALRAVATGCAINSLWILLVNFLHPWVPPLAVMRVNPLNHPLVMVILTQVATGWILARTHRPHEIPMVVMFTISLLPWAAGCRRCLLRSEDTAGRVSHGGCPGADGPPSWGNYRRRPQRATIRCSG